MMKRIKKILSYNFSEKWLAILAILLLGVMLLPIIRLAFYAVPWYDDYNYALYVKRFIAEYGVLTGAMKGAAYVVKTWWWCWQGTFSSIFMMSLMPEAFGEGYYSIGVIGIIAFFTIASMTFVKVVLANVLKAQKATQVAVAVLVTLTMIELIYTAQQGIYWYNAAVHYTFMHGCLLLLLSGIVKIQYENSKKKCLVLSIIITLLALVCSGSNFVTALQGMLLLIVLAVLGLAYKKKCSLYLVPAIVVYAYGLYKNIMAPGNAVRGAYFQGCGPMESILLSFKSGVVHFWEFTGIITIIILGIYALMVWNVVSRLQFAFPMPGLITLLSFGFYCTGFTSSYYGMGTEGVARTWVVIKFTLQLLLFLNVTYWMGWFMQQCKKKGKPVLQVKQWIWAYALAGCMIILWFETNPNQAGSFATYGAYYYVHTGEAANLHNEYQQRVEMIKNSEDSVVAVEPYIWKPWFLYKGELSTDISADPNKSMADWFGKTGIYVKE